MEILDDNMIVPEISQITVRGPLAVSAARSDPTPESFRLVTRRTGPPRPATVLEPKPRAPGNALAGPDGVGVVGGGVVGGCVVVSGVVGVVVSAGGGLLVSAVKDHF